MRTETINPFAQSAVRSVLVDASGTIIDDLRTTYAIVCKILCHYGKPTISLMEFQETFQLPFWKIFEHLGIEDVPPAEFARMYNELFSSYEDNISIFGEVRRFLETCSAIGLTIGIVSQTPRKQLEHLLSKFHINDHFRTLVSLEDSAEQKPAPLPLIIAAERLAASPHELIYVGDVAEDIHAARNARIRSVAIYRQFGSYNTRVRLLCAKPWMLISSLEEIFHIAN